MQETNRAYYRGWYDKFIEPNIVIKDGYLYPPEGPGLGTRLKDDVLNRSDVHIETSDEAYEFNWPGFVDPGQTVGNVWTEAPPDVSGLHRD